MTSKLDQTKGQGQGQFFSLNITTFFPIQTFLRGGICCIMNKFLFGVGSIMFGSNFSSGWDLQLLHCISLWDGTCSFSLYFSLGWDLQLPYCISLRGGICNFLIVFLFGVGSMCPYSVTRYFNPKKRKNLTKSVRKSASLKCRLFNCILKLLGVGLL